MPRLTDNALDSLISGAKQTLVDRVSARVTTTATAHKLRAQAVVLQRKLSAHEQRVEPLRAAKRVLIASAGTVGLSLSFKDADGEPLRLEAATDGGYRSQRAGWPVERSAEEMAFDHIKRAIQTARAGGDKAALRAALQKLNALLDG